MSSPTTDLEIDLESLFEENLGCTSRIPHACTHLATHVVRATAPCPDAPLTIYWCVGRLQLHMNRFSITCAFCGRPVEDCWTIRPI